MGVMKKAVCGVFFVLGILIGLVMIAYSVIFSTYELVAWEKLFPPWVLPKVIINFFYTKPVSLSILIFWGKGLIILALCAFGAFLIRNAVKELPELKGS